MVQSGLFSRKARARSNIIAVLKFFCLFLPNLRKQEHSLNEKCYIKGEENWLDTKMKSFHIIAGNKTS